MIYSIVKDIERGSFREEELALLDTEKIPKHVAIIMDGNRRWAKSKNLPIEAGHWEGAENLDAILKAAKELGVKILTLYAFSTENWNRSDKEVEMLMKILEIYLLNKKETMIKEGIRFETIGNIVKLPKTVQKVISETKKATENGSTLELVLAINYGGRDEIVRAAFRIIEDIEAKKLNKESLNEKVFSQYLDTNKDPEVLIRTSGEKRVSNFLIWQTCYSEIVVTDVLWPDFSSRDFLYAIVEFQKRRRRYGE